MKRNFAANHTAEGIFSGDLVGDFRSNVSPTGWRGAKLAREFQTVAYLSPPILLDAMGSSVLVILLEDRMNPELLIVV